MSEKNTRQGNGAMKKGVAYWQQDWVIKVLSNGHSPQAKLLFMRIASFGEKGCWMNNETFSDEFNRSDRTIRRALTSLWSKGDVIVTGWNGHGRKIYATGHPRVNSELLRMYGEYRKKGKVENREQYDKKVRLRVNKQQVEAKRKMRREVCEDREIRGLAYYQAKKPHTEESS